MGMPKSEVDAYVANLARNGARTIEARPHTLPSFANTEPAPQPSARERLYAKGRLPEGQMNSTEQRYADHLRMQMLVGEVLWWQFEGMNLRLAKNTYVRIDFPVMRSDGFLWMIDAKGCKAVIQDKWWRAAKVAAAMYPFRFATAIEREDRSGWDIEEIVP